ncbi:DUF222 domain-containing protein [uncultured Microbacterium sp.]|uniref:HNH endonuclease signature motif containing protein n=1 Tax=uncultured Microbacterium sp. TaxID=191216 RepID=UPI0028D204B3|nr:DUF222 domain-containing protein [uncultured Microbacterium sp.]
MADAEVAGARFTDVVLRGLRLELAAAMRISEHSAETLIVLAEALVHRYPQALSALQEAAITEQHAEILAGGLDELEPDLRGTVFERALELAAQQPVGQFRRSLRSLIAEARVVTLAQRHEAALQHRRIHVEPAADGMGWTHVYGPLVEAHAAFGRVTAIAKVIAGQDGETRTLDQIRADVAADLLIEGTTAAHPSEARGIRANVVVTVPAIALLEQDDESLVSQGPAAVEGLGPIPVGRARELCGGDATWMRVLTHPETGIVLSVGRTQYTPPAALRRLVKWRADRCIAPGCGVPASRCEVDHTVAWEHGGETGLENLAPICRGHHKVKHHGGWRLRQLPGTGGAVEWTSPAGRTYVVEPERRVPVFTVSGPRGPDDSAPF